MSDNSGEISWTSDDNEAESFTNWALDSPRKIPRYKRRKKKQTRNISNLNVSLIDASTQNNPKSPVLCKTPNVNLVSPILKSTPESHIRVRKLNYLNNENDVKSVDPPSPVFKPTYSNKKPTTSPRLNLSQVQLTSKSKKINKLLFTSELSPATLIRQINKHTSPKLIERRDQCVNMKNRSKSPILCVNNRITSRSFRCKLNFTSDTVVTDSTKEHYEANITHSPASSPNILRCEKTKKVPTTPKIEKEERQTNAEVSNPYDDIKTEIFKSSISNETPNMNEEIKYNNENADVYKSEFNKVCKQYILEEGLIENESKENTFEIKNCINSKNNSDNIFSSKHQHIPTESKENNTTIEIKHNIDNQSNSDNSYSTKTCPDIQEIYSNVSNKSSNKRILPDLTSPPDERIVKKIKSYFENHFSSHSNTQVSICGSTPQSQKADSEIRILTPFDITESNSPVVSQETFKISSEQSSSDANEGSAKSVVIKNEIDDAPKRRRRYKKNGLAGRLQSLLKKQKNQLFLWQHEIYLASNSNFVVPNSNPYRLFGIRRIIPDYGCYLIEAVDVENDKEYLILLNVNFDCNVTVSEKSFLKLFEPFQVIETAIGTVIVNACKFECVKVKDEEKY